MEISILKANNGDAIHLRFEDENKQKRNILIDGGTSQTYQYKNTKGKIVNGELKTLIEKIKYNKEEIDLLILTHVDDDHIGGLLKWIEADNEFKNVVKSVWFNSGNLIYEKLKGEINTENAIKINCKSNTDTSINQGITFETYIENQNIWFKEIILQGRSFEKWGLIIEILTPNKGNLQRLLHKWKKEFPNLSTSKKNDYKYSIKELIERDVYIEDKSVYNGSSISFIIKHNNNNYLFLSDAHPKDIISGLEHFNYSVTNKLSAKLVKISHHGSKGNTSKELLDYIDSSLFIISSNGKIHNLPDKQCLARIINNKPHVKLGFNYAEMGAMIFLEEDFKDNKFTLINIDKVN